MSKDPAGIGGAAGKSEKFSEELGLTEEEAREGARTYVKEHFASLCGRLGGQDLATMQIVLRTLEGDPELLADLVGIARRA